VANLSWSDGIECLRSQVVILGDAWPAVAFRLTGPLKGPNSLNTMGVHLEGTFENRTGELTEAFDPPVVLEGFMTAIQVTNLLAHWREGQDFRFGDWTLSAPSVVNTEWTPDMPTSWLWNPLLYPSAGTGQFRVHRLSGSGPMDQAWREQVAAAAASVGMTPQTWSQAYLGLTWDGSASHFMAIFPIPATMSARYELTSQSLLTEVRFRRPLQVQEFWIRMSPGQWRVSLERLPLQHETSDQDGWAIASRVDAMPPDHEEMNLWGGRDRSTLPFDWNLTLGLSERATVEGSLRAFLSTWYELSGKTPGALVGSAVSGATGRGQHQMVESAVELLVVNSLAALGCSVFFGAKPLDTRGLDCMAFDRANLNAFPISVTIGNDIGEKIRKWLEVRSEIASGIGDHWTLHPVVITAQPMSNVMPADIRSATEAGVLVLTAESLACLTNEPPDVRSFWESINRSAAAYR
jgi:hypothetical protein